MGGNVGGLCSCQPPGPLGTLAPDPVAVAEMFLHTPYLWGGNTVAGIDCSGLAQAALLAAGHPCPGDSDQQEAIGTAIAEGTQLRRGDLIFWKGHVALLTAPTGSSTPTAPPCRWPTKG